MIALSVSFVYSFVFKGFLAYLAIVHNGVSFVHQCLDFGEFSQLSPSFHRAVAHSGEVARYFQAQGFTIGELSECAQEAINAPTKKDDAQSVSEVPIKNKIWAVLSEIGLSRILSHWNMLNRFEY